LRPRCWASIQGARFESTRCRKKSKGGTIIAGPGAVGDLFVTGPVGAEVNNFRAILAGALPDQA
jgi:glycerate-2-kinase